MDFLLAQSSAAKEIITQPIFDPTYLNLGYLYNFLLTFFRDILGWLIDLLLRLTGGDLVLIKIVLLFVAIVLIVAIAYLLREYYRIRRLEEETYNDALVAIVEEEAQHQRNSRWVQVANHMDSLSEADWRLAILEADNILADMLEAMGYHGVSIGEKLKSVEQSDFLTLTKAWEAHKVRNKIAHEGVAFALTKREAERVIALYRDVFTEFHYI